MPIRYDEYHHWVPVPQIMEWLMTKVIKPSDFVIDVGCGYRPFPRGDIALDRFPEDRLRAMWESENVKKIPERIVQCDFDREPLPFQDKEVDFVYCRHMVEDMNDPFRFLGEMTRVGKAGYIETPSPIAELTRGADGFENSYLYRGYYHHRHFVWEHEGCLNFVGKFPSIEYFTYQERNLEDALRRGPELWNTYFIWTDEIRFRHYEDPIDYDFGKEYRGLLWRAADEGARSISKFCHMVNEQMKQAA